MNLQSKKLKNLSQAEFVSLMALLMSLVAMSIDAMLPALLEIGRALGASENQPQMIISSLFLGMSIGQFFYGPISDSIGRKITISIGIGIFIIGCLIAVVAETFEVILFARVLQGIGVASPKIVLVALIRDRFNGNEMAKIMSLIMSVFILVPAIAPLIGQGILIFWGWRAIFFALLAMGVVSILWLNLRQPETLLKENQKVLSWKYLFSASRETFKNRQAVVYALASGLVTGSFVGYLSSVQQIFQVQYNLGEKFPLFFSILVLAVGGATLINASLVTKFGMRSLVLKALQAWSILSVVFLFFAYQQDGQPELWTLMIYLFLLLFCVGVLFGNISSLAIEPLGHIAGVAASVIGSLQSLIAVVFGFIIGKFYDGTVLPLIIGFTFLGVLSLIMIIFWGHNDTKKTA